MTLYQRLPNFFGLRRPLKTLKVFIFIYLVMFYPPLRESDRGAIRARLGVAHSNKAIAVNLCIIGSSRECWRALLASPAEF